jgi:UDP-GlcNAc:undecaprenyl-phosphate/decaprenyl-phosphate GlcNAc-1-phosphate transferase
LIRFHEYIIIFAVAAVTTWVVTFAVRALAKRQSLIVVPDDRRVHERPTPTGGGAGMYLGMLVAIAVASQLPAFAPVFRGSSAPLGVVLAATVIFAVGMADDVREMSPPAKLAGQILAGTVLYFFGVNMLFFHVPLAQTTLWLSGNLSVLATVLWVAVMANSVNFIDGLDGLAAGVVAIAAGSFFVYSHQLNVVGNISTTNAGPLIAVVAVGVCIGFLPHNFYPAKIFMGDAGAMLLGVLVAASTLAVVGQDSYEFSGRTYFFFAPILIPFFILGIPLLDTAFAVVRRAGQRTSPAVADLNHLHHRLMRLGHGHRPAVLILWAWTALLSGVVLWPGITNSHNEIPPIAVGALSILLYTLFAPRGRAIVSTNDNHVDGRRADGRRADGRRRGARHAVPGLDGGNGAGAGAAGPVAVAIAKGTPGGDATMPAAMLSGPVATGPVVSSSAVTGPAVTGPAVTGPALAGPLVPDASAAGADVTTVITTAAGPKPPGHKPAGAKPAGRHPASGKKASEANGPGMGSAGMGSAGRGNLGMVSGGIGDGEAGRPLAEVTPPTGLRFLRGPEP